MSQLHAIQTCRFEIAYPLKDKTRQIQDRISLLFSSSVTRLMHKLFDENISSDLVYKIDNLTLDLGVVNETNMEQQVVEKLSDLLLLEIKKFSGQRVKGNHYNLDISILPIDENKLKVLREFLRTGSFFWNSPVTSLADLQNSLTTFFDSNNTLLKQIIIEEGRQQFVRRRLAYQFDDSFLERLVALLEPEEDQFIVRYRAKVQDVHHVETLVSTDEVNFGKEVWYFILNYLLAAKGDLFSRKELVRSVFRQMAARFLVDYGSILTVFSKAVEAFNLPYDDSELFEVINQLSKEDLQEDYRLSQSTIDDTSNEQAINKTNHHFFEYYLQSGSLPVSFMRQSGEFFFDLVRDLFNKSPEGITSLLSHFAPALIIQRLRVIAGNDDIYKLIGLLSSETQGVLLDEFSKEQAQYAAAVKYPDASTEASFPGGTIALTINVSDALNHFILTGNFPWWFKTFKPEDTLKRLIELSFMLALESVKLAGTREMYMDRMLMRFSYHDILKVFTYIAQDGKAKAALEMPVNDDINLKPQLLKVMWKIYIQSNYQGFDLRLFYLQASRLILNKMSVSSIELVTIFTKMIMNGDSVSTSALFDNLNITEDDDNFKYYSILNYLQEGFATTVTNTVMPPDVKEAILQASDSGHAFPLLNMFYLRGKPSSYLLIREEAIRVLKHFLLWNKLPDLASPGTPFHLIVIEILEFLFESSKPALRRMLESKEVAPEAIIRLYTSLKTLSIQKWNSEVLAWLTPLLKSASENFLIRKEYSGHSSLMYLEMQAVLLDHGYSNIQDRYVQWKSFINDTQPADDRNADALKALRDKEQETALPDIFNTYSDTNTLRLSNASEQALEDILDFFLTHNQLPVSLKFTVEKISGLIKTASDVLFRKNRMSLKNLLTKTTHHPGARMLLQEWILFTPPVASNDLALLMQDYLQNDLSQYLRAHRSGPAQAGSLEELITASATYATISQSKELLLSIVSFRTAAQYLIGTVDQQIWLNLMTRVHNEKAILLLPVIRELMAVFQPVLSGPSERSGFADLLTEFSLLVFAGRIRADNSADFLGHLLAFIDERRPAFLQSMYHHFNARTDINPIILSDPNLQQHLQSELSRRLPSYEYKDFFGKLSPALKKLYLTIEEIDRKWLLKFWDQLSQFTDGILTVLTSEVENTQFMLLLQGFATAAAKNLIKVDKENFVKSLSLYLGNEQPAFTSRLLRKLSDSLLLSNRSEKLNTIRLFHQELSLMNSKINTDSAAVNLPKANPRNEAMARQNDTKQSEIKAPEDKFARYFVKNSGLVLMHPFLPTLFSLIGLTKQGAFVDEQANHRAVLLLQHLVNGGDSFEEHELTMNKILCGYPPDEPVPQKIELTEKEKGTTLELFKIIFQRWDKAKNSTPEGFRNSFIKRQGSLQFSEEGWKLKVEQKGFDLILQTIPWAFGVVKFAWMKQPLLVEWI